MGLQVQHRSFQRIFRVASFLNHFSSIVHISFEEFSSYKTSLEWGGATERFGAGEPSDYSKEDRSEGLGAVLMLSRSVVSDILQPYRL